MSVVRCPSIILRAKEFGEADLLVSFFSREHGRLKGVAKAGRKSRKRFSNSLDLFCLTEMEYEHRGVDLCFLHAGILLEHFQTIRQQYETLAVASYLVELTEILFPLGVPDRRMFELLEGALEGLNAGMDGVFVRAAFEAGAMSLGGFAIGLSNCCFCGRPYTGRGRAVTVSSKGGIACLKCAKETAGFPGLSPHAVSALKTIQSCELTINALSVLPDEIINEIRAALKLHMEYRLGQRPRSSRYLEEFNP